MTTPIWRRWPFLASVAVILLMTVTVDGPIASLTKSISRDWWDVFRILATTGNAKYWLPSFAIAGLFFGALYLVDPLTSRSRLFGWMAGFSGFVFAAIASSGLLVTLTKILVGRERPNVADSLNWPILHPLTFKYGFHSFPSGHANTVFVVAMVVVFFLPRLRIPVFCLAAVLGFCRVLQVRHFPSDWLAGALLAVITTLWLQRLLARHELVFRLRSDGTVGVTAPGRLLWRILRRLRPGCWRQKRADATV